MLSPLTHTQPDSQSYSSFLQPSMVTEAFSTLLFSDLWDGVHQLPVQKDQDGALLRPSGLEHTVRRSEKSSIFTFF